MPCTIFGCGGACAIAAKAASQRRHKTRNGNKGSIRAGSLDLALPRRAQAPFCRVPFCLEQLTYGIATAIPEERMRPLLNNKNDMS
ncbi:hypothetical protein ACSS6W_003860 [Trichoderma asperelloides]